MITEVVSWLQMLMISSYIYIRSYAALLKFSCDSFQNNLTITTDIIDYTYRMETNDVVCSYIMSGKCVLQVATKRKS